MAQEKSIEELKSMRELLKGEIEKSEAFSSALNRTDSRLKQINHELGCFESEAKRQKWRFSSFSDSISHVTTPISAVLRVLVTVRELEKSLSSSDHRSRLLSYISDVKYLGESMRFLSESCLLAVNWLEETIEFLIENGMPEDHPCLLQFRKPIKRLRKLQRIEANARCSRGILAMSFENLEMEFERILKDENAFRFQVLDVNNLRTLQALINTLSSNKRLTRCVSVYVESRKKSVQGRFEALRTDYLEKTITEFDNVEDIEDYIDKWKRDMDIAVKDVYDFELRLCNQVFEKAGDDVSSRSFGQIASDSGILRLLGFGMRITECKKHPSKLLKLLDVFCTMDKVRVDFNRLFGGQNCSEVRETTREFIRGIVGRAVEIFWELPYQVELQRQSSPPHDGSVPRLVSFVTEYCNELFGDCYKPILKKILEIDFSWKHENFNEDLLTGHIYNVMREISLNLDTWARSYKDAELSYIFMMNNHCHFCSLEGTFLGKTMGESWVRAHGQYRDYYAALYVNETWGKLINPLKYETRAFSASKRARESIKRALKAFSEEFDEIYTKQSDWIIEDEGLRLKICEAAMKTLMPIYKNCLQDPKMMILVEEEGLCVRYTSTELETKLKNMFQNKRGTSLRYSGFVRKVMGSEICKKNTHITLAAM
ncbi:PREDICTED: exocyst complex component EXO70A1 [Tarenaya hassleriana]|uniref:exocyst complex component EXO70A1 n=1 Tax=Tarenaya hassleriana TaxID=28532 RepID=UPI00053C50F5|nr:PREDICTED: exocyst complex component EXO70A1 [Tarenaya hassleriana]